MGEAKRRSEHLNPEPKPIATLEKGADGVFRPQGAPAPTKPRKVVVCIPSHAPGINATTMSALGDASIEARAVGCEIALNIRTGDSILCRARDVLVSEFYARPHLDEMVFVDSDIAWDPGTFAKLLSYHTAPDGSPIEIIGGVYRGRGDPPNYVCVPLEGGLNVTYYKDTKTGAPTGAIAEVRGLGTGFLRITRAAVERLVKSLPENHWYEDKMTAPDLKIWHLFDFTWDFSLDPGMRLRSEDYVFCDRFRAAGGRIWAAIDLTIHHSGGTTYSGNFDQFLKGGGGQVKPSETLSGKAPSLADLAEGFIKQASAA